MQDFVHQQYDGISCRSVGWLLHVASSQVARGGASVSAVGRGPLFGQSQIGRNLKP